MLGGRGGIRLEVSVTGGEPRSLFRAIFWWSV